jgi:cell division septal protein FtsQ
VNERFRRSEGNVRVKKPPRKSPLRKGIVVFALGATALLFIGVYELYSFLLTWDDLAVSSVEILCPDPATKGRVASLLDGASWGNLLILDPGRVKAWVEASPWVEASRVRKVFPSSLRVEVAPRRPAAVLGLGSPVLVGRDGVALGPSSPDDALRYPRLVDEGLFVADREFKLALAWKCFEDLGPDLRERTEILDVTQPADVVLVLRGDPTRLKLGDDLFRRRVGVWLANRDAWLEACGPMEYVDLRFEDRTIYKEAPASPPKEKR